MLWPLDVKCHKIIFKSFFVFVCQLFEAFKREWQIFAFEAFDHLVVAGVGIRSEVADVGNVYDLGHLVTRKLKSAAQEVGENI